MILRKNFRRIILILLFLLIGIISITFIFHSFKVKPHNKFEESSQNSLSQKPKNDKLDYNKFKQEQKDLASFAKNFDYRPITPQPHPYRELEYRGKTLPISSVNTVWQQTLRKNCLPPNSAILTKSGDLEKQGIKAIIHLATINKYDYGSSIQGVSISVKNAIILAERNGYKSIAFPLADNNLLDLIFPPNQGSKDERKLKLAWVIMNSALIQRKSLERIVFVDFGRKRFFMEVAGSFFGKQQTNDKDLKEFKAIFSGDGQGITDFSFHKCEVIVNTTFNVEGKFVGSRGLSGFIANRAGSGKNQIQKEIKEHISELNQRLKK